MMRSTMPPTLNCGSSSEPLIGRSTSMTPLRSFMQGDGEQHGQLGGGRAFDLLAESELIQNDFVFGAELAVLQLVLDVERKLAFLDAVADVLGGVGRHRAQFDFLGVGDDVEKEFFGQRIDLAFDLHRRGVVELRSEDRDRPAFPA